MKKRRSSLLNISLFLMLCIGGTFVPAMQAAAEDAPQDMHLTVESKTMTADEIPADRLIRLEISSENLPPFRMLRILLEKDSRLTYSNQIAELSEPLWEPAGMSLILGQGNPDFAACSFASVESDLLDYNGVLAEVLVYLPEDVRAGDQFTVKVLPTFGDTEHDYQSFVRTDEGKYGSEYFTQFNAGVITILTEEGEIPAQNAEPVQQNNAPETPQENQAPEETTTAAAETEQTTAARETTAAETETTAVTTLLQTTQPPETTAAESDTAVSAGITYTTASTTITTTAERTDAEKPETHKKYGLLAALLLGGAGVGTGTFIWIKKRGKQPH